MKKKRGESPLTKKTASAKLAGAVAVSLASDFSQEMRLVQWTFSHLLVIFDPVVDAASHHQQIGKDQQEQGG